MSTDHHAGPQVHTQADPVVIAAAVRTPLGRFQGELSGLAGHQLGAHVIRAALDRAGLAPEKVSQVLMGCVLPAGQGQAPARQAMRHAGLPDEVGATTINKVCGSGMKATMLGHDLLLAGSAEIVVSGGMENMSAAPYLLQKGRAAYRAGPCLVGRKRRPKLRPLQQIAGEERAGIRQPYREEQREQLPDAVGSNLADRDK